jgi:DNA-3-methyladenine glycosylase II
MSQDAIAHLSKADKIMGRLIKKVGPCGMKPDSKRHPFQALVQAIAHQQLNGTAAKTILGRVIALFPGKKFPTPADILATPDEKLRGAGLSRAKVASIKDISAKTLEGVVSHRRAYARLADAQVIERLTVIRGVGPWTVEMLLIFTLGRMDVLPATDFGVRKGFAVTYGLDDLPKPADLLAHGERWRPYRSIAAWYLWRSLEL